MEPLPMRMRRRIVELYEGGQGTADVAAALGTCRSGTRRIRQVFRERGTLEPLKSKPGPAGGLTPERADQLRAAVAAGPGATRAELRDHLGVTVDVRTVGRWLARLGITLKKSRSGPPSKAGPTWPSGGRPGRA